MRIPLLLATTMATLPGPAHAAGGSVVASYTGVPVRAGDNLFVVVTCDAEALPTTGGDVALGTTLWCSVDGIEQTAARPGSAAAITSLVISRRTFEVCISATAVFHNMVTHATYTDTYPDPDTGPRACQTLEF